MSERSPSSSSALPEALGANLRERLLLVGRKLVRVEFGRRIAMALTVSLIGLALVVAIDWLVELPLPVRTGVAAGLGSIIIILLLWALTALVTQRRDEETLALMVEEREPGFRSRLIASIQFARGKATVPGVEGRQMVERMVEDTETFARPLKLTSVVNTGPLRRALWLVLVLAGIALGAYFLGGSITEVLLRRAFLSDEPVPRATRVVWTSGGQRVGVGDTVTIEALVEGHAPQEGSLRIRYESGRRLRVVMERGDENRYRATLEDVQESFSFHVVIRDGKSDRESVIALPRPSVDAVKGRQIYPDYMKLPSSMHRPGEFLLYPGSKLSLRITGSQPLSGATVRLLGGGEEKVHEGAVDTKEPRVAEVALEVTEELSGFTIALEDSRGMVSKDTTVYRVDVLSDEAPAVRLVRPLRQRELVTSGARVLVGYEAEDRFGIETMVLKYKVGSKGREVSMQLPVPDGGGTKLTEVFDWELGGLEQPVQVGDDIEFWSEADDQNERTASGKSAVKVLRVVTPREKRNDLLSRVGDSLGRIGRATDDQERLNTVLSEWIRSQRHLPDETPIPEQKDPATRSE